MAESRFTAATRQELLERFAAGFSVAETARAVELNEKTLKSWLTRGRKDESGPYREFLEAVEAARQVAADAPAPMSANEHRLAVSQAARKGSVQALKLYWEMIRAESDPGDSNEPADPLSELDELAQRRAQRA